MYNADLGAADGLGVLEGVAKDALAGLAGDELDALYNAVDDDVLDAGVFAFRVLSDQDSIDVIVGGLEACYGAAGSQIGEEVESSAESEIEGYVTFADGGLHRLH